MVKRGTALRFDDMPARLPLDRLTAPVRIGRAPPRASTLERHGAAMVLLPAAPAAAVWRALPHGAALAGLFAQKPRKAGDFLGLRVGARFETLLIILVTDAGMSAFDLLQAAGRAARAALEPGSPSLLLWEQGLGARFAGTALCAAVTALQAAAFPLATYKTGAAARAAPPRIDLIAESKPEGLDAALAGAAGNNIARWLTALPPNRLDAAAYRRCLQDLARRIGLKYTFYGEQQLERLGAGAFLAVARGNAARDAGIVRLSYRRRAGKPPDLCLVGKGIIFDTGGTNLKPHKSMLDMHTDMGGSAVAVGCLYALHALRSRASVDCWLAITENRIGPTAYKPQDVVRAHNGSTIQVIHTDAEGRMALADTLCLAAASRPRAIIDFATLTGACVGALTERYSGAFTNRPGTRDVIEAAGAASGERVWCFPMDADFDTDLESQVADVMQCAVEGKGDHILAARFLTRFVPAEIPWLHLDLAAATRHGGLAQVGTDVTGFGVRYTLDLIARRWPDGARSA